MIYPLGECVYVCARGTGAVHPLPLQSKRYSRVRVLCVSVCVSAPVSAFCLTDCPSTSEGDVDSLSGPSLIRSPLPLSRTAHHHEEHDRLQLIQGSSGKRTQCSMEIAGAFT